MNAPLYKVGERVGLVSRTFPERNGEYTVRQVLGKGDKFVCRLTKDTHSWKFDRFAYILEEMCAFGSWKHEAVWYESALRKLHKPSQFSFDELMEELKVVKFDKTPV